MKVLAAWMLSITVVAVGAILVVAVYKEQLDDKQLSVVSTEQPNYANCNVARDAGVAPIMRGEPGYRPELDRDNDGKACD